MPVSHPIQNELLARLLADVPLSNLTSFYITPVSQVFRGSMLDGDTRVNAIIKVPDTAALHLHLGAREVAFYQAVAQHGHFDELPRCYVAQYEATTGAFVLVLDDLSVTHDSIPRFWDGRYSDLELMAKSLAKLHCRLSSPSMLKWFNTLSTEQQESPCERRYAEIDRTKATASFLYQCGSELAAYHYTRIRRHPKAADTITHGDCHFGNILFPHIRTEPTQFIDWDMWRVGCGLEDLACMIGLHTEPAFTLKQTVLILDSYLSERERGANIVELPPIDVLAVYREAILEQLEFIAWMKDVGVERDIWWRCLKNCTATIANIFV